MKLPDGNDWPLFRIIAPAYPAANIYSRQAVKTTPLGPIMVATAANMLWGWRVEVYDENNYWGPRDERGLPDHEALQRERFASVVGHYCGMTSTMERVEELIKLYGSLGAVNVAGSWHAHYCPEEVLRYGADIVVHGEADNVIQDILTRLQQGKSLVGIAGTSILENDKLSTIPAQLPSESGPGRLGLQVRNLNHLPYPDFGLLRHAGNLRTHPISRITGCGQMCEFCSVRGKARWSSPQHLLGVVSWLVETRGAKSFFIVDDRLEEDIDGSIEFFRLVADKFGNSLNFSAQMRLGAATNTELLEAMKAAGVSTVFIGYESPIGGDLKSMKKGLLARKMVEWTHIIRKYFWVHGMFIFGYPGEGESLSVNEMILEFKRVIQDSGISSLQVLKVVPLVGTPLRARMEAEGRLYPLDVVGWPMYDGNWNCIKPPIGKTEKEYQAASIRIMKWFYGRLGWRIVSRAIALPIDITVRGWSWWLKGWRSFSVKSESSRISRGRSRWFRWLRPLVVKYEANRIIREWHRNANVRAFLSKLKKYRDKHGDQT
jgi:hypothetical protein